MGFEREKCSRGGAAPRKVIEGCDRFHEAKLDLQFRIGLNCEDSFKYGHAKRSIVGPSNGFDAILLNGWRLYRQRCPS
jgi:hypothetical protein